MTAKSPHIRTFVQLYTRRMHAVHIPANSIYHIIIIRYNDRDVYILFLYRSAMAKYNIRKPVTIIIIYSCTYLLQNSDGNNTERVLNENAFIRIIYYYVGIHTRA